MHDAQETLELQAGRTSLAIALGVAVALSIAAYALRHAGAIAWFLTSLALLSGCCAWRSHPHRRSLQLTEAGLTVGTGWSRRRYGWNEIERFGVRSFGGGKRVLFNFTPFARRRKLGERMTRTLTGYDAMLPANYGLSADALAVLLKRWKSKFGP